MAEEGELAPCKLCGVPSILFDSHIVPRWTYVRAIRVDGSGDPNLIVTRNGIVRRGGKQLTEFMLCRRCEKRFESWERYVASIAVRDDCSFPALRTCVPLPIVAGIPVRKADVSAFDVRAIERFAMSVFWRASECRLLPATLGPKYHKEIGSYLLDDAAPLPKSASLIVDLVDVPDGALDRFVVAPATSRGDGFHMHRFLTLGIGFTLMIGGRVPAAFERLCIARTGSVIVADGTAHLSPAVVRSITAPLTRGKPGTV